MIAAVFVSALTATAALTGIAVGYHWGHQRGHKAGRGEGFALAWRRLSTAHARRAAALAGAVLVGADGIAPVRADRADETARTDGAGGAR